MSKTAIITGSAKGIGRAIAKALAAQGYNCIINYLSSQAAAMSTVAEINADGGCAIAVQADVSDRSQVDSMIDTCIKNFGSVDLLVNNAGISQIKLFTDITEEEWNRMIAVHVSGTFNCTQAVLPYMLDKKCGKIINISSMWGQIGGSCEVHYSTAKAAVIGFTKALAKELGPSNIQVNCVAPGIIETDMNSFLNEDELKDLSESTPLERFGTPTDVANCVEFLASPKADFITGQVISPNGGFVI